VSDHVQESWKRFVEVVNKVLTFANSQKPGDFEKMRAIFLKKRLPRSC